MEAIKLLYARGKSRDYGWIYSGELTNPILNRIVAFSSAFQGKEDAFYASTVNGKEACFCLLDGNNIAFFRILLPKKINPNGEILETIADYRNKKGERVGCSVEGILVSGAKKELTDFFTEHSLNAMGYLCSLEPFRENIQDIDAILDNHLPECIQVEIGEISQSQQLQSLDFYITDFFALIEDIINFAAPFEFALSNYCPDLTPFGFGGMRKYGNNCERAGLLRKSTLEAPKSDIHNGESTKKVETYRKHIESAHSSITKKHDSEKISLLYSISKMSIDDLKGSALSLSKQTRRINIPFFAIERQIISVLFIRGKYSGKIVYNVTLSSDDVTLQLIWKNLQDDLSELGFVRITSAVFDQTWKYEGGD